MVARLPTSWCFVLVETLPWVICSNQADMEPLRVLP